MGDVEGIGDDMEDGENKPKANVGSKRHAEGAKLGEDEGIQLKKQRVLENKYSTQKNKTKQPPVKNLQASKVRTPKAAAGNASKKATAKSRTTPKQSVAAKSSAKRTLNALASNKTKNGKPSGTRKSPVRKARDSSK
ncbi:hypothetical protein ACA910_017642 [Epithemia clementina (nom. ined.)]